MSAVSTQLPHAFPNGSPGADVAREEGPDFWGRKVRQRQRAHRPDLRNHACASDEWKPGRPTNERLPSPAPRADVGGVSPASVQMW